MKRTSKNVDQDIYRRLTKTSRMGPRHEEGLNSETNFFIQCENEKEEPTDDKKDKGDGDQILDAIGSTKFISSQS